MTTNDPWTDNPSRAHNKRLTSEARKLRTVRNDGGRIPRKRKKYVNRIERAAYAELLDSVYQFLVQEEAAK